MTSFYLFLPFWSINIDSINFFSKHVLLHLKSITKFVFSKIWLNQYFCLKMAKIDKMTSYCHQWRHFWVNFKKFWNFKPYFSDSQKHFVQTLFWQYFDKINISLWKLAKYTENDEIHCFSLGKILRKIWSVNYYEKKKIWPMIELCFSWFGLPDGYR